MAQREALRACRQARSSDVLEAWYDASNYVDIRDYLGDGPGCGHTPGRPTTVADRADGQNWPIFRTEQELAVYRGLARVLATCTETGIGIVERLTDYAIGKGAQYRVVGDQDLAKIGQKVVDEFLDDNDYVGDLDRERFQRGVVDGEAFTGLWHVGGGRVAARMIEPDQITEPADKLGIEEWLGCETPSSWSFGVHTEADDVEDVHGYWAKWTGSDTDWDYLPGGQSAIFPTGSENVWVEHTKRNVTRNVKRGLSDFFATRETLERARKVLKNVGEGAAVQAAIAFFREHDTSTPSSKALAMIQAAAARSSQKQFDQGRRTAYTQQFEAGSIVDHGKGIQYKYGPMGQNNAPVYLEVYQASMRSVSVRYGAPEHMFTGDASNNNYASIFVSENPFVRAMEATQGRVVRSDQRVLWKVLWFAWTAGRFGDVPWATVYHSLTIQIEMPSVAVRDRNAETNRRKILRDSRIITAQRWAVEEGYEEDEANKAQAEQPATAASGAADATGGGVDLEAAAVAGADQNVQVAEDLVLNGAQIAAATAIVTSVAQGVIPRDTGMGQLRILFNLSDEQARAIMGSAGTSAPTTPNPLPTAAVVDASESEAERRGWQAWLRGLAFWKGTHAGAGQSA